MSLQCLQADGLNKLQKGDFSDVLHDLLTNAVSITAPVFFSSATDLFQSQFAAISFGFTGFQYSPCAIPVTPLGVGIFPQVRSVRLLLKDLHIDQVDFMAGPLRSLLRAS